MARKIMEKTQGNRTTKIHWDSDWKEYRVSLYIDGKHIKEARYFTDDKTDAIGSAKLMLNHKN